MRIRILYGLKLRVDEFVGVKESRIDESKLGPDAARVLRFRASRARSDIGLLLEQLRYAGVVDMQEGGDEFTIWQDDPDIIGTIWQQQSYDRMRSFSLNPEKVERRM